MHLLVTNIPEEFRSPDLRNFFSRAVENGSFNCFHFRHRPHKNLVGILDRVRAASVKESSPQRENDFVQGPQNDDVAHEPTCQLCPCPEFKDEGQKHGDDEAYSSPGVGLGLGLGKPHSLEERTLKTTDRPSPCSCTCHEPGVSTLSENIPDKSGIVDSESSAPKVAKHWLSSGLSGLTSLIKETKAKAYKESYLKSKNVSCETVHRPSFNEAEGGLENVSPSCDRPRQTNTDKPNEFPYSTELMEKAEGTCCLLDIKEKYVKKFYGFYHKKYWVDQKGDVLPQQCFIMDFDLAWLQNNSSNEKEKILTNVEVAMPKNDSESCRTNPPWWDETCTILRRETRKCYRKYRNSGSNKARVQYRRAYAKQRWYFEKAKEEDYQTRREALLQNSNLTDTINMIEFRPPPSMPQGNVGTRTSVFKELIRSCKLSGTIISKLGLQMDRGRGKKRFGKVPFDYGTETICANTDNQENSVAFTAAGHLIPASYDFTQKKSKPSKKLKLCGPKMELENECEDGAEVEEWERYEAFHNDVTSQDRTKERLYEKEIELVWEKGGPGLVFYTDAQYWREQEGDFDEQTADEWDVDMSVYYEKGAGDLDAHDSIRMVESNNLRSGDLAVSAFEKKKINCDRISKTKKKDSGKRKKRGPAPPPKIGDFEAHTRGFGRRLLESQGWTDGLGLGKKKDGMAYALDNDGQHPRDKKGFGYYGEKFQGWGGTSASSSKCQSRHSSAVQENHEAGIRISTIFDAPRDVDPPAPHLRTSEPTKLSHRNQNVVFTKASSPDA